MSYSEAQQAAQKLGSFIDLLSRCQKVLDGAVIAEQGINAANDIRSKANADAETAKQALARVLTDLESARAGLKATKDQAEGIAQAGTVSAKQIVDDAKAKATELINKANAEYKSIKDDIANETAALDAIKANTATATTELTSVHKKIADAKAAALALLS